MNIYKIMTFIGAGYILKDKIGSTSTRYYRSNPIKDKLQQIIVDKLDLLFYGNCLWRPAMSGRTYYGYGNTTKRYYPVKPKVDDIYFNTRFQAEHVLDELRIMIDCYGFVTVADYYDACGKLSKFTDSYYGWDDLNDVKIVQSFKKGYILTLPATKSRGERK